MENIFDRAGNSAETPYLKIRDLRKLILTREEDQT